MKNAIVLLLLALIAVVLMGCGTEAKKAVKVNNGQGVVITYDVVDGGSQNESVGKDMSFTLDEAGNITFDYKSESEKADVVTNDPAEVVEAAGEAVEGAMSGGLSDLIKPDN